MHEIAPAVAHYAFLRLCCPFFGEQYVAEKGGVVLAELIGYVEVMEPRHIRATPGFSSMVLEGATETHLALHFIHETKLMVRFY